MSERVEQAYDVVIIGGGLAGLTLARHLLLKEPDRRIALLDRRTELPPQQQKYGEATVQVSGYYYSRVLELEEYLLRHQYLKYNLRFYWESGKGASRYEELSQSYIRGLSNVFTYQLDRNTFEAEVLRVNRLAPNFDLFLGATGFDVELNPEGLHAFRFEHEGKTVAGRARWVVDTSGRARLLAKRMKNTRQSPIRHASSFCWVDGLVDIEKLTDLTPTEIRLRPDRQSLGHVPAFLATNHFCGEGFWFWVIPLHGRTSLGLVFDRSKIDWNEVGSSEKLIQWICKRYPLFARDLPYRKVVDYSGLKDFAHDCGQVLSTDRWAHAGEAGRFTDPLYSPGGDLISIYNTLVADAIDTRDPAQLASKVRLYEPLARAVYEAYVPSYSVSYDTLGDQESFSLRYMWELTVYFSFYVFPFINDLMTDMTFVPGFLRRFGRLGPTNRGLHSFLAGYYLWKKEHLPLACPEPTYLEFYESSPLKAAETCFYKVGIGSQAAREVLDGQVENLEEFARWIVAHLTSVVLDDPRIAVSKGFHEGIDFVAGFPFDPEALAARWAAVEDKDERYPFRHTYPCMQRFRHAGEPGAQGLAAEMPGSEEEMAEAVAAG